MKKHVAVYACITVVCTAFFYYNFPFPVAKHFTVLFSNKLLPACFTFIFYFLYIRYYKMTPDLTSNVLEENPRIRGIAHELCNQLAINREQTKLLKRQINELKVSI